MDQRDLENKNLNVYLLYNLKFIFHIVSFFPYTTTESFMDFFEGLTHVPVGYAHPGPLLDQVLFIFQI